MEEDLKQLRKFINRIEVEGKEIDYEEKTRIGSPYSRLVEDTDRLALKIETHRADNQIASGSWN